MKLWLLPLPVPPAYLSLVDADGQKIRFSAETGAVVGMTSASGRGSSGGRLLPECEQYV